MKRLELTVIYVTHDYTEAQFMADRIAIVQGGTVNRIIKSGKINILPQIS